MQILVKCPKCDASLPVEAADLPTAIACGRCGSQIELSVTDGLKSDLHVDRCPVCGGGDFYLRKDFDPKMGVAVVACGALVSAGFYWFGMDLVAYAVLASAVLVDLIIYQRLGDVTVCYRCHSEFRGTYLRTAASFDLHTADVLEQEYERKIGRR
jgi:DNA-directed RNA polymerase subunit RPC12/RpoP